MEPRARLGENLFETIRAIAQRRGLAVHELSAHMFEGRLFVELHMEVDEKSSLEEAHERATQLENEILAEITAAGDEAALEAVRVAALGKNGSITALLKTLGTLPPEQRKSQGPLVNGVKDRVNAALAARRETFKAAALEARLNTESVDVTLPVREAPAETGRVHPITQVTDELTTIFADMGFAVAEGPDIETDDYNFTKLNFPEDHPARAMHDTFFFNPKPNG